MRRVTALLARRLRLDLRGVTGHFVRFFAAGGMLFTIFLVMQNTAAIGAPGQLVFSWIVWCDSLFISGASLTVFATVISSEREQGTLGLLRMTGTSPLALLLGQGFSGVVLGCLLMAAQFPFIVLTITLGGVLWNQVVATFMALVAHLVLCAGIGLFFSSFCRRSSSAAFYTLLTQFLLWWGPWFARRAAASIAAAGNMQTSTQDLINAGSSWVEHHLVWNQLSAISTSFGATPIVSAQFWTSLAGGFLLILCGAWILDRRPIETPAYSPIVIKLWNASGHRAWSRFAITGKDYRQFMGGWKGVFVRLLIYTLAPITSCLALNRYAGSNLDADNIASAVFWTGMAFLVVELSAIASRLFRNEVAEQTWATLTLLPRRFSAIIALKLGAALLGLLPAILVCLTAAASSISVLETLHYLAATPQRLQLLLSISQPLVWVSLTGVCSMLFVSYPPTVSVFLGLMGYILQYAVMMILVRVFLSPNVGSIRIFEWVFCGTGMFVIVLCNLVALLRLRKLTARD
jgi:hypothetical protein